MAQSLSRVFLHIVFSTKERVPHLSSPKDLELMLRLLATACQDLGCPPKRTGGVADHVHILCELGRTKTIANLVRDLKRRTTIAIKEITPGQEEFRWQAGYGAFSVSQSQVETVERYILRQPQHHLKEDFQDEFRRLLDKHQIDYDEDTVWD